MFSFFYFLNHKEGRCISELKGSLVYIASSKTTIATQRNSLERKKEKSGEGGREEGEGREEEREERKKRKRKAGEKEAKKQAVPHITIILKEHCKLVTREYSRDIKPEDRILLFNVKSPATHVPLTSGHGEHKIIPALM